MIETGSSHSEKSEEIEHGNVFGRPRILLTGLRRSGKTSIQRVIFKKMQPSQTQFLESTPRLTTNQFSCGSFINFQVQELPGQLHIFPSSNQPSGGDEPVSSQHDDSSYLVAGGYDMERLLKSSHAVVYIIDAQDDYSESIVRLNMIIQTGRRVNPKIRYEIFIHKVDQLSEEGKIETQRDIHNQVRDRVADSIGGIDSWPTIGHNTAQDILINFHLTSIYDHSIFEAFSKVIQKLLPQFTQLECLLTHLIQASNIEQAFLFDVQTKISIATDSAPADVQMYELCCDMIDLLLHMSEIYGQPNENSVQNNPDEDEDEDEDEEIIDDDEETIQSAYFNGDNENLVNGTHPSRTSKSGRNDDLLSIETTDEPASNVFDSMSSSVIKLTGGRALYLKEVNRHLALICVLREEALIRQAFIDYNVRQLKDAILKLIRADRRLIKA